MNLFDTVQLRDGTPINIGHIKRILACGKRTTVMYLLSLGFDFFFPAQCVTPLPLYSTLLHCTVHGCACAYATYDVHCTTFCC